MRSNLPLPNTGVNVEQLTQFVGLQMKRLNDVLGNIDGENIVDIKFNLKEGAFIRLNRKGLVFNNGTIDTVVVDINGNASFEGVIEALAGHIGGFTIENDRLSSDSGDGIIQGGTIIGSEIKTSEDTFPRVEFSSTDKAIKVYKDATTYVLLDTDITGDPGFYFLSPTLEAFISMAVNTFLIQTFEGDIKIQANDDLWLLAFGKVNVDSWSKLYNGSQTLQQALDAITSSIPSGDYAVITYSGGVATSGRALTAADIPTLPQSKITSLTTDLAAKASKTQAAFTAATLASPWVNYGGGYANVSYYIDEFGIVRFKGIAKSGTIGGSPIFTLPVGLRPPEELVFPIISNSALGIVNVRTNGDVVCGLGSNVSVVFDGISFRV